MDEKRANRGPGLPLALKTLLFTLLIGAAVALVIDRVQRAELRAALYDELAVELAELSKEDRRLFDRQVQWVRHAARLIASQRRFLDYLDAQWPNGRPAAAATDDVPPLHHLRPPSWLPPNSVLRGFFNASHALLIDADGAVREIYHHTPPPDQGGGLPEGLLNPDALLRKLSHNQSYLTTVEGRPYVVAAHPVARGGGGEVLLLLVAVVDRSFLRGAEGGLERHVMALLDASGRRVVVSSSDQLPEGSAVEALEGRYLMMGKSFFDYGASDLRLQFASFVATARAERMARQILDKSIRQRALLALALVLASALFAMYTARRIRRLSETVSGFYQQLFGQRAPEAGRGDEISRLEHRFGELSREIVDTRDQLRREAEEKLELTLKAMAGEQRALELASLKSVTDVLEVGIVFDDEQGVRPFNRLMDRFAQACGGVLPFLPDDGLEEAETMLSDHDGNLRVFTVRRHRALGPRGALVREVTAQRLAERELNIVANFPAKNPNPVLRVDRNGRLLYGNEAAARLLAEQRVEVGELIPADWRRELERLIDLGLAEPLEVEVKGRVYAFVPALVDGADFLYLYGQEVTARKEAEKEQRLAAAITENVLDGIVVTDVRGVIQAVNPAFTEITGFTAGEVVGRTSAVLKSNRHDRRFFHAMWKRLIDQGQWVGEVWNRRKDGSVFPTILRIAAIRDDKGRAVSFVGVLSDISERKEQEERLTRMAYHDALTRLPNRILLLDRLHQAIAQAARDGYRLALLYLDLDGFKEVNDTLGHDAGDQLLQEAAGRLLGCVRESDTVARLGGDEFALLLPEAGADGDVARVADKVLDAVRRPHTLKGREARVSGSIGIALYPDHGIDPDELLKRADDAMYRAKNTGKDQYAFHPGVGTALAGAVPRPR